MYDDIVMSDNVRSDNHTILRGRRGRTAHGEATQRVGCGGCPRFGRRIEGRGEGQGHATTDARLGRREERRVSTANKLFSYYLKTKTRSVGFLLERTAIETIQSPVPSKPPRSAVDQFEVGTRRPSNEPLTQPSPRPLSFPVTARRLSSCSMPT